MPSRCHVYSCQCYVYLSNGAVSLSIMCNCGIRGSKGGRGPDPPEIGVPLKDHEAWKPAFNVGPSSARQRRNAI